MNALYRSLRETGRTAVLLLAAATLWSCASMPIVPPGARSDLAPAGKLRAAINFGNPVVFIQRCSWLLATPAMGCFRFSVNMPVPAADRSAPRRSLKTGKCKWFIKNLGGVT